MLVKLHGLCGINSLLLRNPSPCHPHPAKYVDLSESNSLWANNQAIQTTFQKQFHLFMSDDVKRSLTAEVLNPSVAPPLDEELHQKRLIILKLVFISLFCHCTGIQ